MFATCNSRLVQSKPFQRPAGLTDVLSFFPSPGVAQAAAGVLRTVMQYPNCRGTEEQRFFRKVRIAENGCWLWTAGTSEGYGIFYIAADQAPKIKRGRKAHIWSYTRYVGTVPHGLELDHLCRNRACVNPLHLEPVTHRVNMLRSPIAPAGINARKTHCKRGHLFTPDNIYVCTRNGKVSGKSCKTCAISRAKISRLNKQQQTRQTT